MHPPPPPPPPGWQPPPPGPPPPGPPPPGPPPGWGAGGAPYPPPRKRPLWKVLVPVALAVVLVAVLGVGAWTYFTGRLGFGPLSAADKAAAALIADEVEGPAWADEEQRACATEELVRQRRSAELEEGGVIGPGDGDDRWSYTGTWPADAATAYVAAALECSEDWAGQLGDVWALEDTSCLAGLDRTRLAEYLAAEELTLEDAADADEARGETVEDLDECYASEPPTPEGSATPAYRAVKFEFATPEVENARVRLLVGPPDGDRKPLRGPAYRLDTEMGGRKGCVVAETVATYGWGTVRTAEERFCGTSTPPRLWWEKLPNCEGDPPCTSWDLRYEGWEGYTTISARLSQDGGDCNSVSGNCVYDVFTDADGRGVIVTWSAFPGWDNEFTARVGDLTARLPN